MVRTDFETGWPWALQYAKLNIKIGRRRLYGLVNVDDVEILTVVVGLDDA